MKNILLITNIPNPYRVPLFTKMDKLFRTNSFELKVVFGSQKYKRRLFTIEKEELQFNYHILDDSAHTFSKDGENTYFFYNGLLRYLIKVKPSCIIVSGFSISTVKTFLYSKLTGTPFIIWTGTIEGESKNTNKIKLFQRKLLSSATSAFIAYGTKTKKYLTQLTNNKKEVFIATNTVDTDYFYIETEKAKKEIKDDGKSHFLYLGYLVPRKNVEILLHIAKHLSQKRKDFIIDILGEGISKSSLETYVTENNLQDFVKFHGFKQKNEIPYYFAQSKALLFQTDFDIWGLVLNEAMASGLPCIASINAGAASDLIEENNTGYIVDYKDIGKVSAIIEDIIENPMKFEEMGKRSSEFIRKNVSLELAAISFLKATQKVLLKE